MGAGFVLHWLTRELEHWRPTMTPDGSGGFVVTMVRLDNVLAKVDQPGSRISGGDQREAEQALASHMHAIYFDPDADIQRGDELRGDGDTFRIAFTVQPSTPRYLKAQAERLQSEPTEID